MKELIDYIDLTPTWQGLLPLYLEAYSNGTPEAQSAARTELERMARLADNYIDKFKAMGVTVDQACPQKE